MNGDNYEDDATADSGTVATVMIERRQEEIRRKKLELDRQLKELENASHNSNPETGGGSVDSPKQQHQQQGYRPPQPPHAFYGPGGFPPHTYGMQQHPPPPHIPPHHMHPPPPTPPSSNALPPGGGGPVDPYYAAIMAAAAAYHQQQQTPLYGPNQPPMDTSPKPSSGRSASSTSVNSGGNNSNGNGNTNSNTNNKSSADHPLLLALLQEKDAELKELRQALKETEERLHQESLKVTKLEMTVEQQAIQHEQENKFIQVQAEKEAQEQLQSQQHDIVQKQLSMMEQLQKQLEVQQQQQQPSSRSGTENESPKPTKMTSELEPVPLSATKRTGNSPLWPDKTNTTNDGNNGNNGNNDNNNRQELSEKDEDAEKSKSIAMMHHSMDESLFDSAGMLTTSNHDDKDVIETGAAVVALKKLSVSREYEETGGGSGVGSKQQASDRFTPVYVAEDKASAQQHASEVIQNPPADEMSLGQTVASSTYGEDRQSVKNKTLLDPYGDKGVFTGVVLRTTGMPHGLGRMIYEEDGRIYEGDWRHGRWHGWGKASFSNGDSYEGEYKFDQRHGQGTYRWSDGRVYDGTFNEDKRHGKGKFTWPDGAVYEGT